MKRAFYITSFLIAASVSVCAQTVKWDRFTNKDEFGVAIPQGSKGFKDETTYTLGRRPAPTVTSHACIYRFINVTAIMIDIYEGDVKDIRNELVSRLMSENASSPYAKVKDVDTPAVSLSLYSRTQNGYSSVQQFVLFKKRLYLVQAYALSIDDPILTGLFRSVTVTVAGKSFMPNLTQGEDPKGASIPPPFDEMVATVDPAQPVLLGKPDREIFILYRPRPRFPNDSSSTRSEQIVKLKVTFLANGEIGKIDPVSTGDRAFIDSCITTAKKMIFIPAIKDGKPVTITKQIEYSFSRN